MRFQGFFKFGLSFLLIVCVLSLMAGCSVLPDDGGVQQGGTDEPQLPQPKTLTDPQDLELYSIIQKAVAGREDVMAFIVFRVSIDHVDYSEDGSLALVWISMVDKNTGEVQNSEPGLVIAHATGDPASPWSVTFQADPTFAAELMAIPESMMSLDTKAHYMPGVQQSSKDGVVYKGYKLPWTKGDSVYLTGSIGHVFTYKSCPSTCLYAFDFANGSMFAIKAAKHGYVKYVQWTYPNGNTTNANYIVLEDPSTTPTTYQVYYHLAQNSIPAALRVVGTEVMQGQYLGNADDTGYSTGNHLHFHVHTTPGSVWGNSVDIVFDEVSINGGRPRTCSEAKAYPDYGSQCASGNLFVSNNGDVATPTGGITSPAAYSTVTSSTINVSGWMSDDTAVASGQLLYNTGGSWTPIGNALTVSPFTQEIDLCSAGISDGTFFLSIEVTDKAGKVSTGTQGLTELKKSYTCPAQPPACSPADNQVALYTDAEYQGTCTVLDIGQYPNLGSFSPSFLDNVRSIQVGSATSILMYPDVDFGGTNEFLQDGDSNLADNTIGAYNLASIIIYDRITVPEVPTLTLPELITTNTNLTLNWTAGSNETSRSTLTGPDDFSLILDWQNAVSWNVGLLAKGTYTWTVENRNLAGNVTISQEFKVVEATTSPISHMIDLEDITPSSVVLLTWEVDQGEDNIDHFEVQYRLPEGEWADYKTDIDSADRDQAFWGQVGSTYEFRLRAVDLTGIPEEYLTVAETATFFVDSCVGDSYEGADPGDDSISGSTLMEEGDTQTHNWCEASDVDWIQFSAVTGDSLRFTTSAVDLGSAALLTLYEPDATTFIGEARPETTNGSASLDWTAPVDGIYYLKVTPLSARIQGTNTKYDVGIEVKSQLQPGTLICGSISIPALLAGGYAVSKEIKKQKKRMERKAMGR